MLRRWRVKLAAPELYGGTESRGAAIDPIPEDDEPIARSRNPSDLPFAASSCILRLDKSHRYTDLTDRSLRPIDE